MTDYQNQNSNQNHQDSILLDIASDELTKEEKKKKADIGIFELINNYMIEMSGVSLMDKVLFFQLLSAMITAGLSILDGLLLLHDQIKNPKMKIVISDMMQMIEKGESLATAMKANSDVFDESMYSVVEAGEKSGKLNEIMKELVVQQEQLSRIGKKIKGVMTYPLVVLTTMVLLSVVVLIFVVPKLEGIFGGSENLPLPTRVLVGASNIFIEHWFMILLLFFGITTAFSLWKKSEKGRVQWELFLFALPVAGEVMKKMILNRITRIFSFLVSAGVPIVDSLKISSHIAQNELYKQKLLLAADDLTKGISIAENLSDDEKLFPSMLVNMIAIGEKSASLDIVMGKAADFYQEELERNVANLQTILEPLILGLIAIGAVFMILAIYLPILGMNDQIIGGA